MKIKIILTGNTINRHLQQIEKMILFNKIKLSNIPRSQRLKHKSLYIMAFCVSRYKISSTEYIGNLKILESDIHACNDITNKENLKKLLLNYLNYSFYNGDELFEKYKRFVYKKTLLQLF